MSDSLKQSIKKTLDYAHFFNYDLTFDDLHHRLISNKQVTREALKSLLSKKQQSNTLSSRRQKSSLITNQKVIRAKKLTNLLRFFPTIKLVALTGSLAVDNAKSSDDIDLMIVTTGDTLWITRPFVLFLTSIFFRRRYPDQKGRHAKDTICINLWLDESALAVPKQKRSLYTAHEVLQVKPLFDRGDTYQRFLKANSWSARFLANAYLSLISLLPAPLRGRGTRQRSGGWGRLTSKIYHLVSLLNSAFYRIQYAYMKSKMTREHVTLHSAYFHPADLSSQLSDL